MVYNSDAGGHYDAAIPYPCTINQTKLEDVRTEPHISCSCGVNKKGEQKSCMPNVVYATRCKCYAQHKSCSSSCHCKNCSNPYGVRPQKPTGTKRQRRPHSMQITLPISKKFAEDKGEDYQLECGHILNQFC